MTDPSPLSLGLGFLAFGVLALAILALSRALTNAPTLPAEADTLDILDGCPHRMLPTAYGWRCANDCGESWYIEESDDLATADLALWELELGADA